MNRDSEVFMVSENEQRKAVALWEKVSSGDTNWRYYTYPNETVWLNSVTYDHLT